MEKSFVKNAADPNQVKSGKQKEKFLEERDLNDLRGVLQSRYGRRFLWRMIGYCGAYRSIWRMSAEIHYLAGMQDVGHFLIKQIEKADPKAYVQMIQENQQEHGG